MAEERRAVEALIEHLVRESGLPDQRARDDLRRELESHFDEAGRSPEAIRAALERFGSLDDVSAALRRAHRRGRLALYTAKVLASVVVAVAAALVVQVFPNLTVGHGDAGVRLGAGYLISASFSTAIVLVLVAAWELDIEPLCARLERRPLRLAATFAALFAGIYAIHPALHETMGPSRAAVASAAAVVVWACTVAIVARLDFAFTSLFGPRRR